MNKFQVASFHKNEIWASCGVRFCRTILLIQYQQLSSSMHYVCFTLIQNDMNGFVTHFEIPQNGSGLMRAVPATVSNCTVVSLSLFRESFWVVGISVSSYWFPVGLNAFTNFILIAQENDRGRQLQTLCICLPTESTLHINNKEDVKKIDLNARRAFFYCPLHFVLLRGVET